MEREEFTTGKVHHGHNIRRTRIEKDIKQDALSQLAHLSQSTVSKYEQMRLIDDEMLERFAHALNVPVDYLKTLEEEAQTVVFENNTVNNTNSEQGKSSTNVGYVDSSSSSEDQDNRVNHFDPIERMAELYERLLKEKDERFADLEKRLQNVEQTLQK